ncbi:hypothetical protein CONLIGDRAFT_676990 [Coniochaeta ligniaria NRRL 30616]|uniref:Uncharacterized protein n=1 Tax=Coniochaeta ligniaria NRRL 30616 TaxID=1408157 RepID=A0A1J7JUX5_9PEZI|nr:hypothetical protein CONLIGDRAFT_676990 [Coniochaeta ligniaria NRRL 30616]
MEALNCHMPQTFFQFDGETGSLTVQQTWGCSDLKPRTRMSWVGNGTTVLPGYKQPTAENPYTIANVTMTALLLEPVQITPVQPSSPKVLQSSSSLDCSNASTNPSWVLSNFVFNRNYHTQWIDFNNHYNDLTVTVQNTATGHEIKCSIAVRDPTGIGLTTEDWSACDQYSETSLSIAYDLDYQWIGVKESWYCNDTNSGGPFNAAGYKQLSLNCTTPKPLGAIPYGTDITYNISTYSCTLDSPQTTITGYPAPVPDFPHSNYNNSCTVSSFNLTSLSLTHFVAKSIWALEQLGSPEVLTHDYLIQLYNPATRDSYRITGGWWEEQGSNETQAVWRECDGNRPQVLLSCEFRYDNVTNEVDVRVQWFCDELDPEHAITFTAEASGTLPELECLPNPEPGTEVGQPGRVRDGDIRCYLSNTTSPVELNITEFTWNSTGHRIDIGPVFPWYN